MTQVQPNPLADIKVSLGWKLLLGIAILLLQGWAVAMLWGWFLPVVIVGLTKISIAEAIGIVLLADLLVFDTTIPRNGTDGAWMISIIARVMQCLFAVGMGWVVLQFIN